MKTEYLVRRRLAVPVMLAVLAGAFSVAPGAMGQASITPALLDRVFSFAATATPLGAPTSPGATDITSTSITWSWTDNASNEVGYKVWSDAGTGTPVTLQIITAANASSWRQQGLLANTLYSFQTAATVLYQDSARTAAYSAWTLAAKPAAPVLGSPKKTALGVSIGEGDGNPADTSYAIQCATTGQWISLTGALVAAAEYHTDAEWGTVTVTGLAPATSYSFVAAARNGAGAVTAVGPLATLGTLTSVPNVVAMTRVQAQAAINTARLVTGLVTESHSNTVTAGDVISQNPASGADAAVGTSVNIVVSLGPAPVTVPNLAGLARAQAQAAITSAQLSVGAVGEEYSNTVAAGNVTFQLPVAGSQVPGGSAVNFMISRGPAPIEVPTLTGLTLAQAESAITAAGLEIGAQAEGYSSTVASGRVMAQVPAAGWLVSPGTAVELTVSKGISTTVTVPNVVGLSRTQAENSLGTAQLTVGTVSDAYSASLPVNSVLSQYPAPGTQAVTGSAVNLVVNRGTAPVAVPPLAGMTREQASTALQTAGLVLGAVTEEFSSTVATGRALSQSPQAGVTVAPGTAVNVVLSKGSAVSTVPDVRGISRNAAEYALLNAGLLVGTVTLANSTTVAPGNVVSQNPASGTLVAPGTKVGLVVSRSATADEGVVSVPALAGLTQEQAESALADAGLAGGAITEAPSETVDAGLVLDQSPAEGTIMVPGATVDFVLSSGPDDSGCGCLQCNSAKSGLAGAKSLFGDFFLAGLSLVTLLVMARKKI